MDPLRESWTKLYNELADEGTWLYNFAKQYRDNPPASEDELKRCLVVTAKFIEQINSFAYVHDTEDQGTEL